MNLILIDPEEVDPSGHLRLQDRRARHICDVHRAAVGDSLRVGLIGGKIGSAQVLSRSTASAESNPTTSGRRRLDPHFEVHLACIFSEEPPPPPVIELLIALPRPKFLSKVIETATCFGIKKITFFNSARVDKIYWSCDQLTDKSIRASVLLGLEQAGDTVLPNIHLRRLFKPFVEDELPRWIQNRRALIAHPRTGLPCPYQMLEPTTIAIGPERGFTDYEISKFEAAGFQCVELFPRILKVETAVAAILGRLI